jgi:RimJ/RimL family protein N-acetyltransferase
MPTLTEHQAFVRRRPYREWWIIDAGETDKGTWPVGSVYLTERNELGIAILAEHQRRGYARAALQQVRARVKGPTLANVAPANDRSHALFKALGGEVVQHTYRLPDPEES